MAEENPKPVATPDGLDAVQKLILKIEERVAAIESKQAADLKPDMEKLRGDFDALVKGLAAKKSAPASTVLKYFYGE